MEDYKANSHRSKMEQTGAVVEEKKKVEKIVNGTAKTKKKNLGQKIAEAFVPEDVTNIGDYLLRDIFVPSAKKMFEELVTNGINILLYGEAGRGKRSNTKAGRVNYNSLHDSYNRNTSTQTRSRYEYDEVVLESRGDAEDVLDRMCELVAAYGMASIADLYDLVGITGNYTDNKYGWTDLRSAYVERCRDGYLIKMPRVMPLN